MERTSSDEVTIARPLKRPARIGDVIADKYRLIRSLGRGGMGRIFEADHLMLDSKVALKFMHPHLTRDPVSVGRFAREARAAATLKSVHAARIIDVDQLSTGELYIVMEYLEGGSLETVPASGRGLPILDAITFVLQACDALAEAHDRGIIHRDVKPANLFLTKGKSGEPMIKVLDFGLAKSGEGEALVASGVMQALGTPQYMSPEQIRGASVDRRTDVWSIGVTLYELLAGRRAFDAPIASNVFAAILHRRYVPVRSVRADVPEALAGIIERCMAHDPGGRFANVRELTQALEGVRAALLAPPPPPPPPSPRGFRSTLLSAGSGGWAPGAGISTSGVEPPGFSTMSPIAFATSPAPVAPSSRQTLIAAFAGPAVVAFASTVMAIVLGTSGSSPPPAVAAAPAATTNRATVAHIAAKSSALPRAKADRPAVVLPARCARHPRSPSCIALARN